MRSLNKRGSIALLSLLLLLALGLLAFTGIQAFQQIRSFQQQSRAVRAGDVHTVRSWMTIHTVSHVYHVPESYLYQELDIQDVSSMRHATLNTIAKTSHKPVNDIVQGVQHAILAYRKAHPHASLPLRTSDSARKLLSLQTQSRRREA